MRKSAKKEFVAVAILILVMTLLVHTAEALDNTIKCQSLSGVKDETGANLTDGDFIQIICTGANGSIDIPPASNGDPTGDDWLVDTTCAGYGFPFEPDDSGKFDEAIDTSNLNVSDIIYCRAWNNNTIANATHYGDSGIYIITGEMMEIRNFGTWPTDTEKPTPTPSACFIATAAYGTPLHEDIDVLRGFRDEYLMTNPLGRAFVEIYYATSPPIADVIRANEGLRTVVREGLVKPLVYVTREFVG